MSDLTARVGEKTEEEQEWDEFYESFKKLKQEGNGIEKDAAILTLTFTAKLTKKRKPHVMDPFLSRRGLNVK